MIHFRTIFACALVGLLACPASSMAQYVAEEVTVGNASTHLFQGSDADGGIGDWYLSNGVVEFIIDEIGVQSVPGGATAPPKQSEIGVTGGTVIDAGLVGADNDQLSQLFLVGGLSTSNFVTYDSIGGATTVSSATITVTGNLLGFDPVTPADLLVTTTYEVAGTDNFMTIATTVENTHPTLSATGLGGVLDVFAWVTRAVIPFSPLEDRGFTHFALDLGNPLPALEQPAFIAAPGNLGPDDGVMDPPSGKPAGEVAYGLLGVSIASDPDAGGPTPPTVTTVDNLFGISNNLISAMGNPLEPALAAGASFTYTRRMYIGDSNDVAAVSNSMITELASRNATDTGTISGDLDAIDTTDVAASAVATMTVDAAGIPAVTAPSPITHFRTDATGAFSGVVLPVGTYDITFKTPERDDVSVTGVVVTASTDTPVAPAAMTEQGFAEISFFESIPGVGKVSVPGRVTFVGIKGTPDPRFNDDIDAFLIEGFDMEDLNEESFAGGLAQQNIAYAGNLPETVALRPGKYLAYGSHGPEYTLKRKGATIKIGKTKKLKFKLKRVVPTPDAISADFHVHSGRSFDTSPPLEARVTTYAAEQVEVIVSTDHDYHTDYSSVISGLGLTGITSIVGNEVTGSVPNPPAFPDSIGHINAWPLTVDPDARRDGSIEDEYVAPNLVFSRLRAQGAEVIQYNHPRAGLAGVTSIGFFNNFGYDPDVVLTSPPNDLLLDDDVLGPTISGVANPEGNRNIDFDCMEIMNEVDLDSYLEMRRDWFSLLNQYDEGVTVPFIGGTSVSDSHRVTTETAGYGRTYVLGVGDDPDTLDVSAMNANIKAGKMIGTTGPFIELTVEDALSATAEIGDTFVPATGDVSLNIKVHAAHWIPMEQVRIYVNGFLDATYNIATTPAVAKPKKEWSGSKKTTRFETLPGDVTLSLSADSWIIVEAGQAFSPGVPIGLTGVIVPGLESIAFTNPIFVDLGGDGFDPPGLPVGPIPRQAAPKQRYSVDTLDLDSLSETKRHQVTGHLPIHKITIPAPLPELGEGSNTEIKQSDAPEAKAACEKSESDTPEAKAAPQNAPNTDASSDAG